MKPSSKSSLRKHQNMEASVSDTLTELHVCHQLESDGKNDYFNVPSQHTLHSLLTWEIKSKFMIA